ncbi:hypothetical protein HDV63DRAFT_143741 [Trichoderma sp. SZMC 28014]
MGSSRVKDTTMCDCSPKNCFRQLLHHHGLRTAPSRLHRGIPARSGFGTRRKKSNDRERGTGRIRAMLALCGLDARPAWAALDCHCLLFCGVLFFFSFSGLYAMHYPGCSNQTVKERVDSNKTSQREKERWAWRNLWPARAYNRSGLLPFPPRTTKSFLTLSGFASGCSRPIATFPDL